MRVRSVLLPAMGKFWWWLRQVTGDAAYENYLGLASRRSRKAAGCEIRCADGAVTAEQFYLDRIRRKYARISRCC